MNGSDTSALEQRQILAVARSPVRSPRILLVLFGIVLICACIMQVLPYPKPDVIHRDAPLTQYLPTSPEDWHSKDVPLGETEALSGTVKKILNYDEALLRSYKKADREFSVYLAYWGAGKMSSREIAFHIPDKCWVAAGWKRISAEYFFQKDFQGRLLAPAQVRQFEAGGARQHIMYWHIFNGRAISYNPDGSPSDLSMLTDLWRRGLRQKGEQYFIRISSPAPLDPLWQDEGFQEVMEQLVLLGPGLSSTIDRFDTGHPLDSAAFKERDL